MAVTSRLTHVEPTCVNMKNSKHLNWWLSAPLCEPVPDTYRKEKADSGVWKSWRALWTRWTWRQTQSGPWRDTVNQYVVIVVWLKGHWQPVQSHCLFPQDNKLSVTDREDFIWIHVKSFFWLLPTSRRPPLFFLLFFFFNPISGFFCLFHSEAPSGKKKCSFLSFFFFTNLFQIIYTSESARIQLYCCCNIMQHHPKCHQGVLYFYWFSCICGNYKNHCHHIKSPELHNRVRMCYKPQHYAAFFGAFKLMDVWLKLRCCIRFSKLS